MLAVVTGGEGVDGAMLSGAPMTTMRTARSSPCEEYFYFGLPKPPRKVWWTTTVVADRDG